MNRRKFIAATSVSAGAAGCLTGGGPGDGDDESADESDDADLEANGDTDDGDEGREAAESESDGVDETDGNRSGEGGDEEAEAEETTGDGDGEDEGNDTDESDPSERTTTFESCTRAAVSGTFADGDVAFASTSFYQDGLVGNTLVEDGVVFGDDVDAPFSGTVVFEIGDGSAVDEGDDRIAVTVPDYGDDGTVITGLTTERSDYRIGSVTTSNPDAEDCLARIEPDSDSDTESDSDSDSGVEARLNVSITDTNSPVDAGDYFEMTVRVENAGDATATDDVVLLVGSSRERVASRTVTLEGGEGTTLSMGYETPPVADDQTFPVRVETSDGGDERSVTVSGTA